MITTQEIEENLKWIREVISVSLRGLSRTRNKPNDAKETAYQLKLEEKDITQKKTNINIERILVFLDIEYDALLKKLSNTNKYIRKDYKSDIEKYLNELISLEKSFFFQYKSKIYNLEKKFSRYVYPPTKEAIRDWIKRFGSEEEMKFALTLLNAVEFVNISDVISGYNKIHEELNISWDSLIQVQLMPINESQGMMNYFFRKTIEPKSNNKFSLNNTCNDIKKLLNKQNLTGKILFFVDDFMGSGHQQKNAFRELLNERKDKAEFVLKENRLEPSEIEKLKNIQGYLLVYHATEDGIGRVQNYFNKKGLKIEIKIGSGRKLVKCFDNNRCPLGNVIFENPDDLTKARELCKTIGYSLLDGVYKNEETRIKSVLGFLDSQQLVVFFHKPPNNTLPIFGEDGYFTGKHWPPLFRPIGQISKKEKIIFELRSEILEELSQNGISRDPETYEQVYFYPPSMSFIQFNPTKEPSKEIWAGIDRETSLYIHIPFCSGHCTYCHYVTFNGMDKESMYEYLKTLESEIELLKDRDCFKNRSGKVIHVGGGTPTIMDTDDIIKLCEIINNTLPIEPSGEYTWESSPETIINKGSDKLLVLLKEGVNRLSIGIESFEDQILKICRRRHNANDAIRSIYEAREKGFNNINIDLIYGLAEQRLDDWKHTIDKAIELQPECITAYHLRKKKGTPMASLPLLTKLPSEDLCREMQLEAITRLTDAGYRQVLGNQFVKDLRYKYRYEVEKYKDERDIIGLGVSAYSYLNGWAYYNFRLLDKYLDKVRNSQLPIELERILSLRQRAAKMVVLGLRTIQNGVDKNTFFEKFGIHIEEMYGPTIEKLGHLGLISNTTNFIKLTPLGILFSDEVCIEFYAEEEKEQLRNMKASKYGLYLPFPEHLSQTISP
jgi:oxygen-independent coproporphyrinogen-3 oxidase